MPTSLPRSLPYWLSFSPAFFSGPQTFVEAGLQPETFLPVPGFARALGEAGVSTYALKDYRLRGSALSQMHGRGLSRAIGIVSPADLFWQIKELLLDSSKERTYVSAYWAAVDTLSHIYGPTPSTPSRPWKRDGLGKSRSLPRPLPAWETSK